MIRFAATAALVAVAFCSGLSNSSDAAVRRFVKIGPRGGVTVGKVVTPNRPFVAPVRAFRAPVIRNVYRPVIRTPLIRISAPLSLPAPLTVTPVDYRVIGMPQFDLCESGNCP